jgi:copper chaperone NosL
MAIVDKQHAAELVTDKGKVFKFDAIECMVAFADEHPQAVFAYQLVRDYNQPEEWQDALTSHYLISEAIPSPMGAYLSAFKDEESALDTQAQKGGEVFTWEALKSNL